MAAAPPKRRSSLDDLLTSAQHLLSSSLNAFGRRSPSPASPASQGQAPRRLSFSTPCATLHEHEVEAMTPEQRSEVWWTSEDYATIRSRQRELALLALRQARETPPGTQPPPIPGESRRGLGVCCEPGTTAERARLVQRGREEIVRAHRGGMDAAELANLCRELSAWAAVNAREVATKDEVDAESLGRQGRPSLDALDCSLRLGTTPTRPVPKRPLSPALGAATPTTPAKRPGSPQSQPRWLEGSSADREPAPGLGLDGVEDRAAAPGIGIGIASMVRSDSFGDLAGMGD